MPPAVEHMDRTNLVRRTVTVGLLMVVATAFAAAPAAATHMGPGETCTPTALGEVCVPDPTFVFDCMQSPKALLQCAAGLVP